eukprot:387518-Prymnesium_polylepis.1
MMREMRDASTFPRAAVSGYSFMLVVYASTAITAYAALGHSVPGFLPDSLHAGPTRQLVGVLLTFHIVVAYLITAQPLHRTLHAALFPRTLDGDGAEARMHWAAISAGHLLVCFVLGNSIPFFADMQALIGSLTGSAIVFGFPAYFYLRAHRLARQPMSAFDRLACTAYLLVATPLLTLLGTWASVRDIARDAHAAANNSGAWQC